MWDVATSPDGRFRAWHEFDAGVMPWDASRIVVEDVRTGRRRAVDVGVADAGVQQPRFSPDGERLGFLCDASGWLNLWVAAADGSQAGPLVVEAAEHGGPAWGEGQRSWAWSPDGRAVALDRNEGGFGRLVIADAEGQAPPRSVGQGVHKGIVWPGPAIGSVRSGARTPPEWLATDPDGGSRTTLAASPPGEGIDPAALPEPEVVTWPADDGTEVPGRLYRAPSSRGLVVWVHGGPTGQSRVEWSGRYAGVLVDGWSLLVPDHRGSTGWGRAWAQALHGRWGELDVEDCAAGIRAARRRGWVGDAEPVVAAGSSAGGWTALNLCGRRPDLVDAVVAAYPVTDLSLMRRVTTPFEERYADVLVGPPDPERDVARSPLAAADTVGRARRPVLLLHGDADDVCPPEHSRRYAAAVAAAGGDVTLHEYPGEGHGWRLPGTSADERDRLARFLDGLPAAGRV